MEKNMIFSINGYWQQTSVLDLLETAARASKRQQQPAPLHFGCCTPGERECNCATAGRLQFLLMGKEAIVRSNSLMPMNIFKIFCTSQHH